jgi:hypothetical protein
MRTLCLSVTKVKATAVDRVEQVRDPSTEYRVLRSMEESLTKRGFVGRVSNFSSQDGILRP